MTGYWLIEVGSWQTTQYIRERGSGQESGRGRAKKEGATNGCALFPCP